MTSGRSTRLLDRAADKVVEAVLIDNVSRDQLIATHLDWQPVRLDALRRLVSSGDKVPEHWHWDWSRKAEKLKLLAYRCFGIDCDGHIQGLMMLSTIAKRSRLALHIGKPVLYIEYIESAPWNLRDFTETPRFSGVGIALLEAAIQHSAEEGFAGRISLHSLPQSEQFYRRFMEDMGIDPGHAERLRYFELSSEQAQAFIEGRKQ